MSLLAERKKVTVPFVEIKLSPWCEDRWRKDKGDKGVSSDVLAYVNDTVGDRLGLANSNTAAAVEQAAARVAIDIEGKNLPAA